VLCRTCRFALISRPSLAAPGGVVVASAYTGRVRAVLLGCKYHNRRAVAAHVGGILVQRLVASGLDAAALDAVTWAPTTPGRRRQRGFDQAESIARAVAAHLGVPCRRLLDRDGGAAQTGRGRRARLAPGSRPRFRAHPRVGGARVLVVDDIVTTGATLQAADTALRRAGATSVTLAAIAATPGCLLPARRVA